MIRSLLPLLPPVKPFSSLELPTRPDVTITYEPLGRQQSVTTSLAKSEFIYDPATLAIDKEAISYNLDTAPGYEFSRVIDRKPTSLGRDTGWQLKNGPTVENEATYGYSSTDGRLRTVSNPLISNLTFTYDYLPNSSLIEKVTGPIHDVVNLYEPNRDVLDTKTNKLAITVISKYDYAVNAIGQRTGVSTSGTAFPNVPAWIWGYDTLGQVTSADSSVNTSDRAYEYDSIGNRKKTADSLTLPSVDNYTANALNQYSSLPNPDPQSPISNPSYDADGNATAYPLPVAPTANSTLVWDAENRLTEVKNSTGTTIEKNLFDSGSRKIATIANGVTTLYLYDAWNCIAEYKLHNSSFNLHTSRLWGMDLSGTLQGAGGVGGLFCESQISNAQISNFYPTYDGNGNVSEYLDSTGQVTAHFEYDPFGNTVVNTDSGNQFAYRFSTKPLAFATGLYYYGYRYYDPVTGRWPSRDPIAEMGGVNIYAATNNNLINRIDILGLDLMNPWPKGGNCGAKAEDIQMLIDALKNLEKVLGKKDSKKCFSVVIHRNATRRDFTSGIIGSCDIAYTITHGEINKNEPDDRWMVSGPNNDNNLSVQGYTSLANKHGCELKPYGCHIAPNRNSTVCGNTMIQSIASSLDSLRPDCCPTVKKVCLFFGPNGGSQASPPYPNAWKP